MLRGAGLTLLLTLWSALGGTLLGIGFGILRAGAPKSVSWLIGGVFDVFRSVPLLIQLIVAASFAPVLGIDWSPFAIACIVLILYFSAYCMEIVRGSILAVPQATRRAARSLGLSYWQDTTSIVFPIALRIALPAWINVVLGVMKDTAIALWIGVVELLRSSQVIVTRTQEPLLILAIAGCIYFLISFPIARFSAWLERRWDSND